jgi:DNA-directed RNA polymerase subunit beta
MAQQTLPQTTKVVNNRNFYSEGENTFPLPNLIQVQLDSYDQFLRDGIRELLEEISPITDFSGKKIEIHFEKHSLEKPKFDPDTSKRKNISYESNLKVNVRLVNKETGEIKQQDVFLGTIPLMTNRGTFVVNGIERVVVNQIVRSPGVFFSEITGMLGSYSAKIIPKRGAWLEIETDKKGIIYAKIDRKRKFPATQLFRIFGYDTDKKILDLFKKSSPQEKDFILQTLEKDSAKAPGEAYQSIYRKIRPGDLATAENAKSLIDGLFFDFKRYDFGSIARYKMNKRFGLSIKDNFQNRVFQIDDFVEVMRELVRLNAGDIGKGDDIDHLSNRRVRSVGELVQNKFRVGLLRVDRIAKDRMTVVDLESITPTQLINSRPITAAMREFFASSQLSQFMDQINPLSELAHKRRLSAMGPGGLSRERAGFDVRDVHPSHYGRICPIATPEGPNIGLVVHFATYARVNLYGFIETPFRKVFQEIANEEEKLMGRILDEDIEKIAKKGDFITEKEAKLIVKDKKKSVIKVRPFVTKEIEFFDADSERGQVIAQANSLLDEFENLTEVNVAARIDGEAVLSDVRDVTLFDISPKQIISETTALIPFLEHDDNTRASMGSNMQRQAVPLIQPESPIVGTGLEMEVAVSSGQAIVAEEDGEVLSVDAMGASILYESGVKRVYTFQNYVRTNQATCSHMRPVVRKGQKLKKGDGIADGASVEHGDLALGRNLLVAYMSWGGYNFEDAIIISDRVAQKGFYDSIHIESFTLDIRETKLGNEILTRDIPNVGEAKLKDLDDDGIVRIGAWVNEGDILVGKITPKGETELTPEERLLQAIFGEKAKDVRDSSLRLPGGEGGKVIDLQIFSREQGDELPQGVLQQVRVFVAQTRKVQVGDKMAGRHGNKGVVSRIVSREDMPFLPDGTHVDIILNPLGVSSRMNIGQILETHLGWAGLTLGVKFATPVLNGIEFSYVSEFLKAASLPEDGKIQLYDGRTGEPFAHKTTVGIAYILKLAHLVEDKLHARSVGPYSIVTQQPLGGKAQHGGQRFGEMEVWALEAYGAAHTLQEMLTIKSDDVVGRSKAYEAIVKGFSIQKPSIPESFNVLVHELRALGLDVDLLEERDGVYKEVVVDIDQELEEEGGYIDEDDKVEELRDAEIIRESDFEIEEEVQGVIDEGSFEEEEILSEYSRDNSLEEDER